jgi:hypothetical protein
MSCDDVSKKGAQKRRIVIKSGLQLRSLDEEKLHGSDCAAKRY